MTRPFIHDDFLLHSPVARTLYHEVAAGLPIFDYHCHLPPEDIASNRSFENLTQIWLEGDHYKWRAMRANGVDESFITGDQSDWAKFEKWAETVPATLRNPLYHWTHMELKRPFGVTDLQDPSSAKRIYDSCGEQLASPEFTTQGLLKQMNVKVVCTTDDPVDQLEHHRAIADGADFGTRVYPTFRPDAGMAVDRPEVFNAWVDRLESVSGMGCSTFDDFLAAIQQRHDYFHENGCRLSDHGLEQAYAEDYTASEIAEAYAQVRHGASLELDAIRKFQSCMLLEFGRMDAAKGWVQQYHLGAYRNSNTRLLDALGPDTGFDSIGDFDMAVPLGRMLDRLDSESALAKTILYNLNPRDNEVFATMIGNFQDGSVPGKMQFGSGWWFLDQKDGMTKQINALSNLGLLSRFVGMLTDSRSFLSYPRHEYFRRILCGILGEDVERGELPEDMDLLSSMVSDICWNNAVAYFEMELD